MEFSDNPDLDVVADSGTTTITDLGVTLSSETRSQSLSLELGAQLVGDFGRSSSDDFETENVRAIFSYAREGANSGFDFSASYTETTLDDSIFLSGGTLIIDTGAVDATRLSMGVELGREGPFGVELDALYFDRNYRNTSDPDLNDTETIEVDAIAHFRINPAYSVRARAGISREDENDVDSSERETHYVGLGLEGETAGGLTYFGDIIYDSTETTTSAPSMITEDGIGIELGLTQARVNGSIGLDVSSRIDESGRRSSASVNRAFDFPEGALSFSLGVVDQEGDDSLRVIGALDYTRELAQGDLTASLVQDAATDSGTPYLNTTLALNFRQEINAVSSWEAGLEFAESNQLGGTDDDTRGVATVAYNRSLTEDWSMRTGLEHIRTTETGLPDRSSNTVFFNIQRDITFGF
ncbi:MAG: hypothetical protein HKN18_12015 [Silicimonas sp.]|nr:hypothetical protein [Silicimonas sp.]